MAIIEAWIDVDISALISLTNSDDSGNHIHILADESYISRLQAAGLTVHTDFNELPAKMKTETGGRIHEYVGVPPTEAGGVGHGG
jgi:hypothetical protein